jgi:hypothetical protein
LAFGTLLDSPAEEDTAVFATSPSSRPAPERDWGQGAEQQAEQPDDEDSNNGAWRSSSMDDIANDAPAGQTDWREAAFSGIVAGQSHQEWAPSVEKNSLSISEEEAAEVAKVQQPFASENAARGPEDWSKAINAIFDKPEPVTEPAPAPQPVEVAPVTEVGEEASAPQVTEDPAPESNGALNSWMAGALSPWEAELQRANQLSSTWDSASLAAAPVDEGTSATEAFLHSGLLATAHENVVEAIEEAKAEQVTSLAPAEEVPAQIESLYSPEAHEEVREAEESTASTVSDPEPQFVEASAAPSNPPPSAEPNMDELVANVLAKLNPDVLQAVTREILKPVVEALVRDELSKK